MVNTLKLLDSTEKSGETKAAANAFKTASKKQFKKL